MNHHTIVLHATCLLAPEAATVLELLELLDGSNNDSRRKEKIREAQAKLETSLPAWAKRDWRWAEIVESCKYEKR